MKRTQPQQPFLVLVAAVCLLVPFLPLRGQTASLVIPLGLDRNMPIPKDNPLTPAKIALGKRLFNDNRLSADETMSCESCHDPQHAFSDQRMAALGIYGRHGPRRVPRLINRAYGSSFFWDGRASTLEEQVLQPIANPNEMGMTVGEAVRRIKADRSYRRDFKRAFKSQPTSQNIAQALASYVRSILSGNSPYDRYVNGDPSALTAGQERGLELFRGKANCIACHPGPNFTDEKFHNTGIGWRVNSFDDDGRFAVTHNEADRGAFKTPTLRDVADSPPYTHQGRLSSLKDLIDFYDAGGNPNPHLDPQLHPLQLSPQEKQDLIDFLSALNGTPN
ncbi:MAG TPA: cytochrome c peroxidase [Candidatus Acidoferrales bacterium]|nr:cytochrome c peroxidase [Candidatus Acidoferrales bacterium]